MNDAACRDTPAGTFYPTDSSGLDMARRICGDCEVSAECLDYALYYRIEHGVWGGASEAERRKMVQRRRLSRPEA